MDTRRELLQQYRVHYAALGRIIEELEALEAQEERASKIPELVKKTSQLAEGDIVAIRIGSPGMQHDPVISQVSMLHHSSNHLIAQLQGGPLELCLDSDIVEVHRLP